MWTAAGRQHVVRPPPESSTLKLFLAGLAVTIGNPKIMAFYLAVLPAIIDLTNVGAGEFAALAATMGGVLIGVDLAWVAMAASARRLFKSPRALKIANRCGAAAMGGAAAAIATR
jgi:threonine/homoserine/homoserine lactone efflux protein